MAPPPGTNPQQPRAKSATDWGSFDPDTIKLPKSKFPVQQRPVAEERHHLYHRGKKIGVTFRPGKNGLSDEDHLQWQDRVTLRQNYRGENYDLAPALGDLAYEGNKPAYRIMILLGEAKKYLDSGNPKRYAMALDDIVTLTAHFGLEKKKGTWEIKNKVTNEALQALDKTLRENHASLGYKKPMAIFCREVPGNPYSGEKIKNYTTKEAWIVPKEVVDKNPARSVENNSKLNLELMKEEAAKRAGKITPNPKKQVPKETRSVNSNTELQTSTDEALRKLDSQIRQFSHQRDEFGTQLKNRAAILAEIEENLSNGRDVSSLLEKKEMQEDPIETLSKNYATRDPVSKQLSAIDHTDFNPAQSRYWHSLVARQTDLLNTITTYHSLFELQNARLKNYREQNKKFVKVENDPLTR